MNFYAERFVRYTDELYRRKLNCILSDLSRTLDLSVKVNTPLFTEITHNLVRQDQFTIFVWGVPFLEPVQGHTRTLNQSGFAYKKTIVLDCEPLEFFGINFKGASFLSHGWYSYNGVGIDIADGNCSVAELVDNTLYIFYRLLAQNAHDITTYVNLFEKIVDEVTRVKTK